MKFSWRLVGLREFWRQSTEHLRLCLFTFFLTPTAKKLPKTETRRDPAGVNIRQTEQTKKEGGCC